MHGDNARGPGRRRGDESGKRLHWLRTLAAKGAAPLRREHLRFQRQRIRAGELHCFLLDCSGSMLAERQLARVLGLLRVLQQRAYQRRAQVALIGFCGNGSRLHLDISAAQPSGAALRQGIGAGGGTPLAEGLRHANALLERAARTNPARQRWLWLFTDGRCRDTPPAPPAEECIVVDCERQRIALGRCLTLAQQWRARYRTLDELLDD